MSVNQQYLVDNLRYEPSTGLLYWLHDRANGKVKAGDLASKIQSKTGYRRVSINNKYYAAHRLVWMLHNGNLPDLIDHIDGDRANNVLSNLRIADKQTNSANRNKNLNNTTGYRGVVKIGNRFRATIGYKGTRYDLGMFDTAKLAHQAYELKSKELRKDFHRHVS